jgi:mannose-6-phosphate isomerase-like protein (cupin superfamily)
MNEEFQAFALPQGAGEHLHLLGETITIKIDGRATDGRYAVVEEITPPAGGAPPHVHETTDELGYVLAGEYEVRCGGRTFRAAAGAFFTLPKRVPHSFRNVGDTPARALFTILPSGLEDFFRALSRLPRGEMPSPETLAAITERHDIRLVAEI